MTPFVTPIVLQERDQVLAHYIDRAVPPIYKSCEGGPGEGEKVICLFSKFILVGLVLLTSLSVLTGAETYKKLNYVR